MGKQISDLSCWSWCTSASKGPKKSKAASRSWNPLAWCTSGSSASKEAMESEDTSKSSSCWSLSAWWPGKDATATNGKRAKDAKHSEAAVVDPGCPDGG